MSSKPRHPAAEPAKGTEGAPQRAPLRPSAPANDTGKNDTGKPAAGPHARPDLTDAAKTPGTGALPDPDKPNEDATLG
ncbi:hypothetical protein V5F77_12595 [Xanthobacter sp. DSM 24535]|uniref:hypothetical protein n=1 Tax=Roseixanthobacter psychrophilus TaxID=3119917 RepID=UPI00372C29AB